MLSAWRRQRWAVQNALSFYELKILASEIGILLVRSMFEVAQLTPANNEGSESKDHGEDAKDNVHGCLMVIGIGLGSCGRDLCRSSDERGTTGQHRGLQEPGRRVQRHALGYEVCLRGLFNL